MLRFWNRDLQADLGTPRLTWRRLRLLIEQLPDESATVLQINPDAAWSLNDHLLALAADALIVANWQRTGDDTIPKPEPISRPGVNEKAPPIPDVDRRLRTLRAKNLRRR